MKVLFVGEGSHDIGSTGGYVHEPFPAEGTIPALCRRVIPKIAMDSVALRWVDIVRLQPSKKGFEAKARAARLIAERRVESCKGLVLVVDNDGDEDGARLERLRAAKSEGFPVACGVAVESIEAWTLGATSALATVLRASAAEIRRTVGDRPVEALKESSPRSAKQALSEIASLDNRVADTAFRQEVAELTDVAALAKACPRGFEPFVEELREAFE